MAGKIDLIHFLLLEFALVRLGTSNCNVMQRVGENECVCPGDEIRYECSISGAGSTVWNGTLFHCPKQKNEISLLHSRFHGTGYCNSTNESIAAHAIKRENICFTSQLIFNVNTAVNPFTITCAHDNELDLMPSIIDSRTITVTTNPYPPPSYLQLTNVNGKDLKFTWEPFNHSVCLSLYYEPLTNCSSNSYCITASGSANCSISMITSIAQVCSFAIRPVICGNIVGNKSETVNIILKVPEAPTVDIKPEFFPNDTLKSVNLTLLKVKPFIISGDFDGSATSYTIVYSDSSSGSDCGSFVIPASDPSCDEHSCTQVKRVLLLQKCQATSGINITVYATNIFGKGTTSAPTYIATGIYSFSDSEVTLGNYSLIAWALLIFALI